MRLLLSEASQGAQSFDALSALPDAWQVDGDQTLWLDLTSVPSAETLDWLKTRLGLHPLALADALQVRHPPKAEVFSDHVFMLFRGLAAQSKDLNYETIPIALFIGSNWLVTIHRDESLSINRVWDAVQRRELSLDVGSQRLACRVLRAVVDRYTPLLLNHEGHMEQLEAELFSARDDRILEELVSNNTQLKKLRRTHAYHADAIEVWREEMDTERQASLLHEVNDIYEHYERLASMANLFQELTTDLMQSYMSLSAHRLNRIMQTLTVFTVLFLPLTLLTGIYGMNFEQMPELHWHWGYPTLIAVMLGVVSATLWWFKKRQWW